MKVLLQVDQEIQVHIQQVQEFIGLLLESLILVNLVDIDTLEALLIRVGLLRYRNRHLQIRDTMIHLRYGISHREMET